MVKSIQTAGFNGARTVYEDFHIFHFQKRIVSTETICGNTIYILDLQSLSSSIKEFLLNYPQGYHPGLHFIRVPIPSTARFTRNFCQSICPSWFKSTYFDTILVFQAWISFLYSSRCTNADYYASGPALCNKTETKAFKVVTR